MAALSDVLSVQVLGDGSVSLRADAPLYCPGGQVVLTADEVGAIALTHDVGGFGGSAAPVAAIDLKDLAFALRNSKYSADGALLSQQLPMSTTAAGRLLVNAPGYIEDGDARVQPYQLRVFGAAAADHVNTGVLTCDDIRSTGFQFVRTLYVDGADRLIMVSEHGQETVLPLPQRGDLDRLAAAIAGLQRVQLGVAPPATGLIDQPAMRAAVAAGLARVSAGVAAAGAAC